MKRGKIRVSKLLFIFFLLLAIIISFTPMATYSFNSYFPAQYKNNIADGSCFKYNGTFGGFIKNDTSQSCFFYGFNLKVIKNSKDNYTVSNELFNISSYSYIQNNFNNWNNITCEKTQNYEAKRTNMMIDLIFPINNSINLLGFNYSITSKTIKSGAFPLVGCGNLQMTSPYYTPNADYIKYNNGYALNNFYDIGPEYSNTTTLFKLIDPSIFPVNGTLLPLQFSLQNTNTAPPQNWFLWLEYGFAQGFPVDAVLLVGGMIFWIMSMRKGKVE